MSLGLVATKPGQGTFVVQKLDPLITTLSGRPRDGVGGGEGVIYRCQRERASGRRILGASS